MDYIHFQNYQIAYTINSDKIWFKLKDVGKVLDVTRPASLTRSVMRQFPSGLEIIQISEGRPGTPPNYVSAYAALIIVSRSESAIKDQFRDWIFSVILEGPIASKIDAVRKLTSEIASLADRIAVLETRKSFWGRLFNV